MYTNLLQNSLQNSLSHDTAERNAKRVNATKKGFAKVIPVMFLGALAFAFTIYFIYTEYNEHFRVVYIIKSAEADRHVINMAQVLMAYPKLVKNDSYVSVKGQPNPLTRLHRAVLDEEKLDIQMVNDDYFAKYRTLTKASDLAKDVNYPDSVYAIVIEDLEGGKVWALSGMGPIITRDWEEPYLGDKTVDMRALFLCLSAPPYSNMFDSQSQFWDAFNYWNNNCEASARLKQKTSEKSFPVVIMTPGEKANVGKLTIRMTEW